MNFVQNTERGCLECKGCCETSGSKLSVHDWLCDIPEEEHATAYVEVQFKNTRKEYFLNEDHIPLEKGDIVAVEASPGHDIGMVTLTGRLVLFQLWKHSTRHSTINKKIYRIARPYDLERWEEAKAREHETMIRSRQIAAELGLDMKIGDVEFQGDGNKAIFYYIAEGRVDFRQLIRVLADNFHVRIEMKQIGVRQEAGRIGGIGPCGRELCCASWMSHFTSVSTEAARLQDISMNPQKLAGQCGKLKCCINYEADMYVDARKGMPSRKIVLETKDNAYYYFKTDLFKREITYSTDKTIAKDLVTLTARQAFDVINMNQKGIKPDTLLPESKETQTKKSDSHDILDDNVSRFDSARKKRKKKRTAAPADGRPKAAAEGRPKRSPKPSADGAPQAATKASAPKSPRRERKGNNPQPNPTDGPSPQ